MGGLTIPVGGDIVQPFTNSQIGVNGTTTLDSTAFGRIHVIGDPMSSDYTITLPAASGGNNGKAIGFRFRQVNGSLVRLTGATMGGLSDRYYITGEFLVLRSNGGAYEVDAEFLRHPWFKAVLSADQTGLPDNTWVTAQYNSETDPYGIYDNSTYVVTANRPGRWEFIHHAIGGPEDANLVRVGSGLRFNTTSGGPSISNVLNFSAGNRRLLIRDVSMLSKGNTRQAVVLVDQTSGHLLDDDGSFFQGYWIGHE